MAEINRLDRDFFARNVLEVARDLIGATLWTVRPEGVTAGEIVEAEAYADATDEASHVARHKKGRMEVMHAHPGVAYIYRSYGIHTMLNIVSQPEGFASAVLIRALRPVEGIELMKQRRGIDDLYRLCKGPGSLTEAMGIRLDDHGVDLVESDWIWVAPAEVERHPVAGERIGISRSRELPWRFFIADSKFVSAHRRFIPVEPTT